MKIEEIFSAVYGGISGENIRQRAMEYHPFPLKLGYSAYSQGINFLAESYRKIGLEAEVLEFPADGKTTYADRHYPLAWDVDEAWAEVDGERIADYDSCSYSVVPFSAASDGICEARIVPVEDLPTEGSWRDFAVLITHYPAGAEIRQLMERGAKVFLTSVDTEPIHPSLENSRRWFNDLFGAGQIDCRDKCCCGFSLTPKIARELVERYRASGAIPLRYCLKSRTYAGKVHAVTALLRGRSERCFFVTSHAYEPHGTNNVAGVACALEIAASLKNLIDAGVLPQPDYSIRFFHGLENFGLYAWGMAHREEMKTAVGGVSLDSFGRLEAEGKREHFVLRRSLNIHPSNQHALAEKILDLASQASGIGYEVREASKNNEDLMQDPLFGPPWNLLYGSLWEEPRETYPRCYFYHTSIDTPDKLSPVALSAGAAFAGALAYCASAGANLTTDLAELARHDWENIVRAKCREALNLLDTEPELRRLRGQRLAAWRELALVSANSAIGNADHARKFAEFARKHIACALEILCGGEPPKLRSDQHREVLIRTLPGPIGLGTISEELRDLAAAAQGYRINEYWCFDDSGTNYYFFDGQKSVFEVALAVWATRAYLPHEDPAGFETELTHYSKLAEVLVKAGLATLRPETPAAELKAALAELGIRPGDTVMVHSSYKSFGGFVGGPAAVIKVLQEAVTPRGIVAMPAFTDCADGGTAGSFDPDRTPVEKWVGIIPETFRRTPGVHRSLHPTHSVCAWGNQAKSFIQQRDSSDCFAPDGPWAKLAKNGKILFLGEAVGGNTFLHACEAWFNTYLESTQALVNDTLLPVINYPGGCRGNWYKLGRNAEYFRQLKSRGIVHEAHAGAAAITLIRADELANAMQEIFRADPAILLHKSGCRDCAKLRSKIKPKPAAK